MCSLKPDNNLLEPPMTLAHWAFLKHFNNGNTNTPTLEAEKNERKVL